MKPDLSALHQALAQEDAVRGLADAVQRLQTRYRQQRRGSAGMDAGEQAAYAQVRMPATAAAVAALVQMAGAALASARSLLDLGSGTGAGLWATMAILPHLAHLTAVERDPGLITIGRRLTERGPPPLPTTTWIQADLTGADLWPSADLVLLSYAWGEIPVARRLTVLDRAWQCAGLGLVLIEPGTPAGFAVVQSARGHLLERGAVITAPCTHHAVCPLPSPDPRAPGWCHFAVRLPRSRLHRHAKGGALGYEDEKFSGLVALKTGTPAGGGRELDRQKRGAAGWEVVSCQTVGLVWSNER